MVHYFNPGHEAAILNGSPYYHAPANVVQMQRDLAFLPAWYACEGDFVLVEKPLTDQFNRFWYPLSGFSIQTVSISQLSTCSPISHQEVSIWGISPQSLYRLHTLSEKLALGWSMPSWNPFFKEFSHRRKAFEYLREMASSLSFVDSKLVPRFCTSLDEIESLLRKEETQPLLAKAPFSSSGRGLLWLPKGHLTQTERQILHGILKKQGSASIEYALEKRLDFAMEFECDGVGGCRFAGYSLFETTVKGGYLGNRILSQERIQQILTEKISLESLLLVQRELLSLFASDLACLYKGFLGVDMMIYVEAQEPKLHPCVEINLRTNMGILSVLLRDKYVHPEAEGRFAVDFSSQEGDLLSRHGQLSQACPAVFLEGKMRSGYFSLCPITADTHYAAYLVLT